MRERSVSLPLTVSMVSEHPKKTAELLKRKRRRRNECFIGVCILDGTFLCGNAEELNESLEIGEKLVLEYPKEPDIKASVMPISVLRSDNSELGFIPFECSILPSILASRGIETCCYIEAKRIQGGLLSVAVSLYCTEF